MTFLLFLFGIFLALGMFLLTADLLRLPRLATQRAMLSVGRQEKEAGPQCGGPAHGLGDQAGPTHPYG